MRAARLVPLLAAFLLALVAGAARAQSGINLSWNDCGASGSNLEFFACGTNSGFSTLYPSVVIAEPMPQLNGVEIVIDVETSAAALSPWWQMGTGQCRASSIISVFDFTGGPFSCADPWQGQAVGGLQWTSGFNGPNRARLRAVAAIPGSTVAPSTEMYVFAFRFLHVKSTGAGSCAGCDDKAILVLNSVQLTQPSGVGDYTITNPWERNYVSWRCSGSYDHAGLSFFCSTPAKSPSWGAIKSLYR